LALLASVSWQAEAALPHQTANPEHHTDTFGRQVADLRPLVESEDETLVAQVEPPQDVLAEAALILWKVAGFFYEIPTKRDFGVRRLN
jgi:hypothetical protein